MAVINSSDYTCSVEIYASIHFKALETGYDNFTTQYGPIRDKQLRSKQSGSMPVSYKCCFPKKSMYILVILIMPYILQTKTTFCLKNS